VSKLAIILSHPVQYYSPLFVELAKQQELKVFYGYQPNSLQQGKEGFGQAFQWDVDLLSGYTYEFLENVAHSPSSANYKGCDTPNIGKQLQEYGVTHIVSFGWHLKMYRQALTYAKRNKIPIAVRGDSQLNPLLPWWKKVIKRIYYPFFLKQYDAFLSVGQRNQAYLNYYGVDDQKIIFSPHAVNHRFWKVKRKREGSYTFIWVGKFIALKRPLDVIDAFKEFQKEIPESNLKMIGSGNLLPKCKECADGVDGIEFLGFRNQTELKSLYAQADCLILSSESETWGLVVNEALATGLPAIVSSACGCGPDLIDEFTGHTYRMGEMTELVNAMTTIYNHNKNQELFAKQQKAIMAKNRTYSFERNIESFKQFIENF
jgi:glycosyltransferase involved in cell wall biosynthesis